MRSAKSTSLVLFCLIFIQINNFAAEKFREFALLSESFSNSANLQDTKTNDAFQDYDNSQSSEAAKKDVQKAHDLAAYISKEQRYLDKLDSLTMVTYPIGLVSKGSNLNYTICLDNDEVDKDGTHLSAYMSFSIPQTNRELAFTAKNIPLNALYGH